MKKTRNRLWIASFVLLFAWTAMLFPQDAADRKVTFSPAEPAAGLTLIFTASHFRTPNLLQWDMGDGTRLTSGGTAARGKDVTLAYSYTAPGRYLVRVYDDLGNTDLPPVTVLVTVAARPSTPPAATPPPPPASTPAETVAAPVETAPAASAAAKVAKIPTALEADRETPASKRRKSKPLLKFGPYAGYFRPQEMWFKKIYGDGDMIYGARLGIHLWKGFYAWISGSRVKMVSKTTFSEDKTTMTLLPLSAFLRYCVRLGFLSPYAGIGFTRMEFKEESEIGNTTGNGSNTAYEAGFEIKMNRHFIMDLSIRYDKILVNPTGFAIDLGGVQAGIALLLSF